ncbi:MAG TPA: phosphoribosylformylglycinamidine synthase subunit PurS [Acidimicrobiales bacterium]|nr:phosphoribosylformylglycinamidine synthase subunit PurS [Acidimicrobiales bacterium]
MRYRAFVEITGLEGIADPEGQTIERALPALGFEGVERVHVGKAVRFLIEAPDEAAAYERVASMCDRLLANPVIERASIRVEPEEPVEPVEPVVTS